MKEIRFNISPEFGYLDDGLEVTLTPYYKQSELPPSDVSTTTPPDGTNIIWYYGDGECSKILNWHGSEDGSITHKYTTEGIFTIKMFVWNDGEGVSEVFKYEIIREGVLRIVDIPEPVAKFDLIPRNSFVVGDTAQIFNKSTGEIRKCKWTRYYSISPGSDVPNSTKWNPKMSMDFSGEAQISLIACNERGRIASDVKRITIASPKIVKHGYKYNNSKTEINEYNALGLWKMNETFVKEAASKRKLWNILMRKKR